jgi:hypothetical protein
MMRFAHLVAMRQDSPTDKQRSFVSLRGTFSKRRTTAIAAVRVGQFSTIIRHRSPSGRVRPDPLRLLACAPLPSRE